MTLPTYLTVREAADVLRCSPRHVRRLIHKGRLNAVQSAKGACVLIPEESILACLKPTTAFRSEPDEGQA